MVGRSRLAGLLAWLLVAATAVAGCAKAPVEKDVAAAAASTLHGVVVDEAVRPVAAAEVTLGPAGLTATTDDEGLFAFEDLVPGAYVLTASKARYLPAQVTAVVEGGVTAGFVQVQLQADPVQRAFYSEHVLEGYIECGTSLANPCEMLNFATGQAVTNDLSSFLLGLSTGAQLIQAELVWSSTQAATPELGMTLSAFEPGCPEENYWILNQTSGASPIVLGVDAPLVAEQAVGGACPLSVSVGPAGPYCTDRQTLPGNVTVSGACPGATMQQRFTIYAHAFYNYRPYAGWRLTDDPIVPPPPALTLLP